MALRGAGRIVRSALVVVGGLTVGAGVLSYAAVHSQPSFRVSAQPQLMSNPPARVGEYMSSSPIARVCLLDRVI